MSLKIALAGNPNCGKTTLFNALTGSNQYVGNWPGVTVEKKEGRLKNYKDVVILDLPGIYSLSPYSPEEIVARNDLIGERPDAIINIVDGTNLERNLYLTTQLLELGCPVVLAVNMMDLVAKRGGQIDTEALKKRLGCEVVEISALKGTGVEKAAGKAVAAAQVKKAAVVPHWFNDAVEAEIAEVGTLLEKSNVRAEQRRFFAIKLLEKDERIAQQMDAAPDVSAQIARLEEAFDDDAESILANERYRCIASIMDACVKKRQGADRLSLSDRIDRVVTNRVLALPIFAVVMWLVYFLAMSTVGAWCTDWTNDNLFGDGFHLLGIGSGDYEAAAEEFGGAREVVDGFIGFSEEQGIETDAIVNALDDASDSFTAEGARTALEDLAGRFDEGAVATLLVEDEETLETTEVHADYKELKEALAVYEAYGYEQPEPEDYGVWVPGIPALVGMGLEAIHCADWLSGLILDGIVAGVGAVLGFVPQMLVLFLLLAFLEYCGYMSRIAFILDRVFRKFGLSGKSFIPMLVGMGCGVPGVMASRTIESEKDRRMTIMTTTFIPCGAKTPFIAMIAGAVFGGSPWIATSAYFMCILVIICSGIMLKKTRMFAGDPAPFVMELPEYRWPKAGSVLRSMWERGWSFIKKAGTIILLSTIVIWFMTYFGVVDGRFTMLTEEQIDASILAAVGNAVAWIFVPQGWGNWQAAVASVTGLVAKENIVGTMGILYGGGQETVWSALGAAFTTASGYSFLAFNLLCAPCFAAMGAIRREMNSAKWFWFAVGYQCGIAYLVSLVIYRIGGLMTGACTFDAWTIVAILIIALFCYMLLRPEKSREKGRFFPLSVVHYR